MKFLLKLHVLNDYFNEHLKMTGKTFEVSMTTSQTR